MALCPSIWCRNYHCHFTKPDAHWATLNSSVLYGTLPRVTVLKSPHLKKNPDNPILLRTLDMHCYSGPNTDVYCRYPRNGNAYLIFIMVVFFSGSFSSECTNTRTNERRHYLCKWCCISCSTRNCFLEWHGQVKPEPMFADGIFKLIFLN